MRKSRTQIYDELLVIKCRQGDKDAFEELVGRWQKRLWRYAYRVTGSESVAWDIVQETWFAVIKGISRLKDLDVFSWWIFRILNNKCADWVRKQQLESGLNSRLTEDVQNQPDSEKDLGQRNETLRAAVERLSPDRRALLELRYREGFDIEQISEITGVPQGTVKSRLHRTLNQLRRIVGRNQDE